MTIASAPASASRTSGVGRGLVQPLNLDPLDRRLATARRSGTPAARASRPGVRTRVRTGSLAHRQHPGADAERPRDLALGCGQVPPSATKCGAVHAGREVAVGELEPARGAELDEALEDRERVVADPPAALLVDLAGQPVGDQVGIGRDVEPEDSMSSPVLAITARSLAEQLLHPGRELRPARPAGEHATATVSGERVHRGSLPQGSRRRAR